MHFLCGKCFVLKLLLFVLVFNAEWQGMDSRKLFDQSEAYDPYEVLSAWYLQGRTPSNPFDLAATWCQYRDLPFHYTSEVFRLQSSFGCYIYTAPSRFDPGVGVYNQSSAVIDGLPYQLVVVDGVKHNVDYMDPASVELISKSLLTQDDTDKWMKCSKSAGDCCSYMLSHVNTEGHCPDTWDGWYCWHNAPSDTIQYGICPDFIYSGSAPLCYHKSSKRCFSNGTWNATTNYVGCDITPRMKTRTIYHVTMLSISLAVSVPAIVIFLSYRKLRSTMRVILNRNLLIAIVTRNILTIISKTVIILDAMTVKNEADSVMAHNGAGCKILTVLEKLATNAVFACMLLLGVYLHRLIAAAFRGEPNMVYYFVAAGAMSGVPVFVWSIVTATLNNRYCWTVDNGGFQWINDSFKIAMLAVNMVLIADIIRVLVTKLGSVNTGNSKNIRRTTKATIFLLPVFGVQFVFTAARPNTTNCTGEQVFYYFSYGLDGIQGAVVSLLFCYLNTEVRSLLGKTMSRAKNAVHIRLDKNYVPRDSDAQDDPRRITFSTMVEPNHKDISAPPTPVIDAIRTTQPTTFVVEDNQGDIFRSPKTSESESAKLEDIDFGFFTPSNSLAGSPPMTSHAFFTPRSSLAGNSIDVDFYDCIDDMGEQIKFGNFQNPNINDVQLQKDSVYHSCTSTRSQRKPEEEKPPNEHGFSSAAEKFNDKFDKVSKKSCNDTDQGSGIMPANTSEQLQYFDNPGLSLSTENLPDDIKTVLRKRIPSLDQPNDSEV